jgi:RNA polymerase sigma-70 factor (ECF subfamily)
LKPKYFSRIQQGNKLAFDSLFKLHYASLCKVALIVTTCESLAEEAVQQFFIHLWEKRSELKEVENEKAYLYRSVYNQALQLIRSRKARRQTEQAFAFDAPTHWQPEERAQWDNFKPYIEKAIANLPEQCRHIFLLKRMEGLTTSEIANYLGVSEKTVENQTTIAIKKLRNELQPLMQHLPIWLLFSQLFE